MNHCEYDVLYKKVDINRAGRTAPTERKRRVRVMAVVCIEQDKCAYASQVELEDSAQYQTRPSCGIVPEGAQR